VGATSCDRSTSSAAPRPLQDHEDRDFLAQRLRYLGLEATDQRDDASGHRGAHRRSAPEIPITSSVRLIFDGVDVIPREHAVALDRFFSESVSAASSSRRYA